MELRGGGRLEVTHVCPQILEPMPNSESTSEDNTCKKLFHTFHFRQKVYERANHVSGLAQAPPQDMLHAT